MERDSFASVAGAIRSGAFVAAVRNASPGLPVNEAYDGVVARAYDTWLPVDDTWPDEVVYREAFTEVEGPILELGCGTGRHSIELARRGYKMVGVDLSESQLQRAEDKARDAGVQVTFLKFDARKLPFIDEFGLVIMLCEGAFPLMETDEMNFQILQNAAKALKPNGKLIFTTLNGLFPLFHSVKEFIDAAAKEGNATQSPGTFDLMTFRDRNTVYIEDDLGRKRELQCSERYYVPSEITWLLKSLGFRTVEIFGVGECWAGDEFIDGWLDDVNSWATNRVGAFDFPMIDNTRLSNNQRAAVSLIALTPDVLSLKVAYFPSSRASAKREAPGPITPQSLNRLRHMGPRFRGDDSGEVGDEQWPTHLSMTLSAPRAGAAKPTGHCTK